jgi:phospho-N-acetylmuramoyl-pentapeptide-transferase
MLYHFLYPLSKYITGFNVFYYITFRSVIAFLISFIICIIFFPAFIKKLLAIKAKQVIRTDGPATHQAKVGTPTMGGLLIIISMLISMAVCGNFSNLYILIILFATVSFGIIGFLDDYLKISRKSSAGLQAKFKLITQFLAATAITTAIYLILGDKMTYLSVPFLKNFDVHISWLYIPFGILLIVFTSNAVNLTDGLDGLASGLLISVVITFGILSYIIGHKDFAQYLYLDFIPMSSELLVYCFAFIGGLCGFLWFNCHPAEIFMGDAGSLSFGGIIGTMALMVKQELLLFIVGGVFFAEAVSVMIQVIYFKFTKKRVFLMAPLHHHFELKGWKESKVITRFWIIGGILAIITIGSLKLR